LPARVHLDEGAIMSSSRISIRISISIVIVLVLALFPGCAVPAAGPTGQAAAISGGTPHAGHPAVGRLRVGTAGCGGTLVGKKTVLTAAHCVDGGGVSTFVLDDGSSFEVEKTTLHPGYANREPPAWDWRRSFSDLALLRLKQAPPIDGIAVSTVAPARGLPLTIVGYGAAQCRVVDAGSTNDAGGAPTACDGADVKRSADNSVAEVFEHELSIEGAANACVGDSGGAVLATVAGKEVLIGLPSHGELPCGTRSYALRVDAFFAWIDETAEHDVLADRTLLGDGGSAVFSDASAGQGDSTISRNQPERSATGCSLASGDRARSAGPLWLLVFVVALRRRRSGRRSR
jgi:hypothetical protein